jgi:hypothetical protein
MLIFEIVAGIVIAMVVLHILGAVLGVILLPFAFLGDLPGSAFGIGPPWPRWAH